MPSKILEAVYAGRDVRALLAATPELTIFEAAAVGDVERIRATARATPRVVRSWAEDGWTPLHLAAFFGHPEAVTALVALGADVQAWAENSHRNQPLHAAIAGHCEFSVVTALIDARANVNAKDGGGFTPLHLAAFRGDAYVTELLLARGADVRLRTDGRKTALDLADEGGHVEVARRLRGEQP
jgi:ankyrin repeat protein